MGLSARAWLRERKAQSHACLNSYRKIGLGGSKLASHPVALGSILDVSKNFSLDVDDIF